jgi:GT2 family glycosyltransferase
MTAPRCSVIIPVHNKALLTKQCLGSILGSPAVTAHELIVVDDASSDSTQELLAGFGDRVRSVRLTDNAGFATACNSGAAVAASSAEFLLFLNNDTIALDGWLDALVSHADAHQEAAVVGSKLLYPDGTIQHAGVVFNFAGDPLHIYVGCASEHQAVNRSRPFQVVTAACCLVRRSDFEALGGFDTGYHNDLEDVDLCLRLGALGREIHYCHESVLVHLESASRGRTSGPGRSAKIYRERWGDRVRPDELDYYLEDGLLDVLRTRPDKLELNRLRRDDADVLQARSRQFTDLLREMVRVRTHGPNRRGEVAGGASARRRSERRARTLRDDLAGPLPTHQPVEVETASSGAQATDNGFESSGRDTDYELLLNKVHETIVAATDSGSNVLVVGKGDDRLLRLRGRSGWHFPRAADGRYAGYHPQDSREAIAHLERLRQHGAGYIVFPRTSLWWLEYYTEFSRHLSSRYELARSGDDCVIFDVRRVRGASSSLAAAPVVGVEDEQQLRNGQSPDAAAHEAPLDDDSVEGIRRAVAAELPPAATVLVAAQGDARHLDVRSRRALRFPTAELGIDIGRPTDAEAVMAHLEESRARGAEFLVFPKSVFHVVEGEGDFADYLHHRYSTIFYDDSACLIFELADRPVAPLVRKLVPEGAWVAVAAHHPRSLAGLDGRRTVAIPLHGDDSEVLATVDAHASKRGGFLVLPRGVSSRLTDQPLVGALRARYRLVTEQEHVCEIYDLRLSTSISSPRDR